jgi:hypothetical protein
LVSAACDNAGRSSLAAEYMCVLKFATESFHRITPRMPLYVVKEIVLSYNQITQMSTMIGLIKLV